MKYSNKKKLDFQGDSLDHVVLVAAAKTVVKSANDINDAILILDMLGIIKPQVGNEPVKRYGTFSKEDKIERREKREKRKLKRKSGEFQPSKLPNGVSFTEIGEPEHEK